MGDMADMMYDDYLTFMANTWWSAYDTSLEIIAEDRDYDAIHITWHAKERFAERFRHPTKGWTPIKGDLRHLAFRALMNGERVDDQLTDPTSAVRVVNDGFVYVFCWDWSSDRPILLTLYHVGDEEQKERDMRSGISISSYSDDEINAMFLQERKRHLERLKQDWYAKHDLPDDEDLGL